jgi:spore coat protein A
LLRDALNPLEYKLPSGKYDIPIAIQDRIFNTDGSMWFPTEGNNPSIHPNWQPEFFGNTIMVNGKVWPNLNVDKGQYRFRLLDGSNARFYNLKFEVQGTNALLPFIQIGTDGGFLKSGASLTSLLVAPGERADVLVDFSSLKTGDKVIIKNDAPAPYPDGMPGDTIGDPTLAGFKNTVGQIMQFTVQPTIGRKAVVLPTILNPTLATPLPNAAGSKRFLTLAEVNDPVSGTPVIITLNGQRYDGALTETPRVGSTEDWYIINLTPDQHPIHLLTQFQLVSRTPFNDAQYKVDWLAQQTYTGDLPFPDTYTPTSLDPSLYTTGPASVLTANEKAWKDTVQCPPHTITVLRVRFAPQDSPLTGPKAPTPGVNKYSFDPTVGSYVWHCHIIDHEDNEMMRPYTVVP